MIVLFDGVCNLCNGAVQFLLKHDKKEKLQFASLQSTFGQELLMKHNLPTEKFGSIVFMKNNKLYQHSDAVIEIAKALGRGYRLFAFFYVIPKPLRDALYSWIAKNRYKWFGKKDQCMLPTPQMKKRFIE